MFGAEYGNGDIPREPHTLPEAYWEWENTRGTEARIRRIEDAWALHASRANGFGGAETCAEGDG